MFSQVMALYQAGDTKPFFELMQTFFKWTLGINSSEVWVSVQLFQNMHLEMLSAKCHQPFYPDLNISNVNM